MSTIERPRLRRLNLGCAGITMTPAEFDAIRHVDDRFRYELIQALVIVSRFPAFGERDPNAELERRLRNHFEATPDSTFDVTFSECYVYCGANRRRADRLVWAGFGRLPDPEVDIPTIAIEFVSQSKRDWLRDYEEKRVEYLTYGIAEYWVINRFARTMTVFQRPPAEPSEIVIPEDGTYASPLLPGFELPLAALLKKADLWPPKTRRSKRMPGIDPVA